MRGPVIAAPARFRGRRASSSGAGLIEILVAIVILVVAIVGVLAALAVYGVNKYVTNAKTTEARSNVARMAKDATTAYSRPKMAGTVLVAGESSESTRSMCPEASPVPANAEAIQGKKYQSEAAEWSGETGWECLQFSMSDPQMYQYEYEVEGELSASGSTFTAIARGDLDGDGTLSSFSMNGAIQEEDLALFVSPNLIEENPNE